MVGEGEGDGDGLDAFTLGVGRGWLACVCARAGRRGEALQILQENVNADRLEPVPNRRLLILYGCLGDKERAFEYLEKMYAEREPWLPFYLMYPELAWMRNDPRFATLQRAVGLPSP